MNKMFAVTFLAMVAIGFTLIPAFAQEQTVTTTTIISNDINDGIVASAIAGATAGLIMSGIRVMGKHIKGEDGAKPDPSLFGKNILIGALVPIGITLTSIEAVLGLATGAIGIPTAFLLLYVVNQIFRPMYGNWIKGRDAQTEE